MTTTEWALLVAIVAHGAVIMAALLNHMPSINLIDLVWRAGAGPTPTRRSARHGCGRSPAAAGLLGAAAIEALQEALGSAQDALVGIAPFLDAAKCELHLVTLIGIGVMLWARIDVDRHGLR